MFFCFILTGPSTNSAKTTVHLLYLRTPPTTCHHPWYGPNPQSGRMEAYQHLAPLCPEVVVICRLIWVHCPQTGRWPIRRMGRRILSSKYVWLKVSGWLGKCCILWGVQWQQRQQSVTCTSGRRQQRAIALSADQVLRTGTWRYICTWYPSARRRGTHAARLGSIACELGDGLYGRWDAVFYRVSVCMVNESVCGWVNVLCFVGGGMVVELMSLLCFVCVYSLVCV